MYLCAIYCSIMDHNIQNMKVKTFVIVFSGSSKAVYLTRWVTSCCHKLLHRVDIVSDLSAPQKYLIWCHVTESLSWLCRGCLGPWRWEGRCGGSGGGVVVGWWCGVSYTSGFWVAKFRKALESMARIYSVKGSIRISNLDIGGMRASLAYRVPPGHAYEAKVSPMKDYFMDDSRFG